MRTFRTIVLLFAAAVLTRVPFTSRLLYNMDSVQFALGTDRFDVALHQPQPPGYYLYVIMGRLSRLFTDDANTALVAISILFSGLAVVMLYYVGRDMFDEDTALAAAVLALTSPLFWFHGEVALSYMPEAFMSVLVAYLCYRMLSGEKHLFWLAAVAIGVAGGIRQNTMVFLMPLWLFSMRGLGPRRFVLSLLLAGVTVLSWFVPMLIETGGYARYSAALRAHWLDANWRGIHLHWIAFNARYMSFSLLYSFAFALVPVIFHVYSAIRGRTGFKIGVTLTIFFSLWIMPAFLFHLLIFTHPAVPGHTLIYAAGLVVLAARSLVVVSRVIANNLPRLSSSRASKVMLAFVAAGNCFIFVFWNSPFGAKAVATHDRVLSEYIDTIKNNFSPADTEIIGSERFILSYRHAMYYLPEYRVYDNVLITTPEGPRLFWGQDRRTRRSRYITPLPTTRRYVDFYNYDREEKAGLPEGARFIQFKDGFLVYYEKLDDLYKVSRIEPFLDPSPGGMK